MDEFQRALLEAADEALLQLSESVRHSIYWYLKNRYGLAREEVPFKPEEFARGLRSLFGEGADMILEWVARGLYAKLGLPFEERPDWGFMDYVSHAKESARRSPAP